MARSFGNASTAVAPQSAVKSAKPAEPAAKHSFFKKKPDAKSDTKSEQNEDTKVAGKNPDSKPAPKMNIGAPNNGRVVQNAIKQEQERENKIREQNAKETKIAAAKASKEAKVAAKKAEKAIKNNEEINIGTLPDECYGPLLPYIKDDSVTDINWNGRQLWIDNLKLGRYCATDILTDAFVQQFSTRVSNVVSESFNKYNPRLEAETEELRISILHSSVARTGTSISIRKTPAVKRINFNRQIANGDYCSEEMANFMSNCVKSGLTSIICGLPGDGKTELVKYLTSYIPPKDRVITIEDNLEIHYHRINPDKDCVEMKVDDSFTYVDAIKASLRQLPKWILVAEARSVEVKHLLEAISTGAHCMTTIHTDDVRKLPKRIKNMIGGQAEDNVTSDIFTFIDVGILIRKKFDEKGNIFRYLDQIGVFDEEKEEITLIFNEGKRTDAPIPNSIARKFRIAGIIDPFKYQKLPW